MAIVNDRNVEFAINTPSIVSPQERKDARGEYSGGQSQPPRSSEPVSVDEGAS